MTLPAVFFRNDEVHAKLTHGHFLHVGCQGQDSIASDLYEEHICTVTLRIGLLTMMIRRVEYKLVGVGPVDKRPSTD